MNDIWISLAHVKPASNNIDVLDGAKGAFVNVVAIASSDNDFLAKARNKFETNGLSVISFEDVSLLSLKQQDVDPEILELAGNLNEKARVLFDEFQAYEEE